MTARVLGTAQLERLEVVCNGSAVLSQSATDRVATLSETLALSEEQTSYLYLRATQSDGHVAWSSPIWVSLPQH